MTMLESLAASVAEWFPELEGRSIAVSEVDPFNDKTNVPSLPLAVVALVSETNVSATSGNARVKLESDVLIQFIFEPVKYQKEDGSSSPFFAFYDYEVLRDTLLAGLRDWRTPGNGSATYKSLDVESDEFAVYIAVRLTMAQDWCQPRLYPEDGCLKTMPPTVKLTYAMRPASDACCEEDCTDGCEPDCFLDT